LIADERHGISRQFGGGRITYLVDRSGIVRFIQQGVPDSKELLRELEKLEP